MSMKSYWRGYIDAQGDKRDYYSAERIATNERKNPLKPLAEYLEVKIEQYRSGFMVRLPEKLDKLLPATKDEDYMKGWFAASGRRYKEPFKLTITGEHVGTFVELVRKYCGFDLPKVQKPSSGSKSMRVIVTGIKARELDNFLRS